MELKFEKANNTNFLYKLLIVPYGIEISAVKQGLMLLPELLIVPYGIEINYII